MYNKIRDIWIVTSWMVSFGAYPPKHLVNDAHNRWIPIKVFNHVELFRFISCDFRFKDDNDPKLLSRFGSLLQIYEKKKQIPHTVNMLRENSTCLDQTNTLSIQHRHRYEYLTKIRVQNWHSFSFYRRWSSPIYVLQIAYTLLVQHISKTLRCVSVTTQFLIHGPSSLLTFLMPNFIKTHNI